MKKWLLFDEFIPQIGERINHREGEQLLDLYMSILRDKVVRGDEELKLILFANAEDISTPVTRELEVIDEQHAIYFIEVEHPEIIDKGYYKNYFIRDYLTGEDELRRPWNGYFDKEV